jgi:hypothetical protein
VLADPVCTFVDDSRIRRKEVSPVMKLRALLLIATLSSVAAFVAEWGWGP